MPIGSVDVRDVIEMCSFYVYSYVSSLATLFRLVVPRWRFRSQKEN